MAEQDGGSEPKPRFEPFWTIRIGDIRYNKGSYQIKAHFIYCVLTVQGSDKFLDFASLTPEDAPFELVLPKWMFPKKRFDHISPHDIYRQFVNLFSTVPFAAVPEAPVSLPFEKIPPSKRAKMMAAAKQDREKMLWNPPDLSKGEDNG
jgi:hypothetical protein